MTSRVRRHEADADISKLPLGRAASVEEVANVVVFLACGRASYLSGIVVTIDGGQAARGGSFRAGGRRSLAMPRSGHASGVGKWTAPGFPEAPNIHEPGHDEAADSERSLLACRLAPCLPIPGRNTPATLRDG